MSDQAKFNILFICTGNTCRSPMAQAIAERSVDRRAWDGVEIRSAGVSALRGEEASEGARAAAKGVGLSLEGHESTPLDADLVSWAGPRLLDDDLYDWPPPDKLGRSAIQQLLHHGAAVPQLMQHGC